MRLRSKDDRAYLSLDESATAAERLVFTHEDHREAWGMNFDFDADGRLVGIEFEDPGRQLPERLLTYGEALRAEWDELGVGAAYIYLTDIPKGGIEHTLIFGDEENRAAWGINLDFDRDDRLLGIEFESDDLAPIALLQAARRLPPPPTPPRRGRLILMRFRDYVRDLPYMAKETLRARLRWHPRKADAHEDDGN